MRRKEIDHLLRGSLTILLSALVSEMTLYRSESFKSWMRGEWTECKEASDG